MKNDSEIIPRFYKGLIETRKELRRTARSLLESDFDDAIKIYEQYLQEEPSAQDLVEAAESRLDDYVQNSHLAHDSSIRCYRRAIRSLTPADSEMAERIRKGLKYLLAENSKSAKNKSSYYETNVDGCEKWLSMRISDKLVEAAILDKYANEQISTSEDWRTAAKALLFAERLDDAEEIYRIHLNREAMPADAFIEVAERYLKGENWSDGQNAIKYLNMAMDCFNRPDTNMAERIRSCLDVLNSLARETETIAGDSLSHLESLEKELSRKLDSAYDPLKDASIETEKWREYAMECLASGCIGDAINVYENRMESYIPVTDLLIVAALGRNEEIQKKCWEAAVTYINNATVETLERLLSNGRFFRSDSKNKWFIPGDDIFESFENLIKENMIKFKQKREFIGSYRDSD